MTEFSNKQRKHLKKLAGLAYEREMNIALGELFTEFKKWENSNLNPFDLNDKIHQHHDIKARTLYKIYVMGNTDTAVAISIAQGTIKEEEVEISCLALLERSIEFYKENSDLA